jgi:hypothetical protein
MTIEFIPISFHKPTPRAGVPHGGRRRPPGAQDEVEHDTPTPINYRKSRAMRLVPRGEVPDVPDRIIAAPAIQVAVPLLSRDGRIRAPTVATLWSLAFFSTAAPRIPPSAPLHYVWRSVDLEFRGWLPGRASPGGGPSLAAGLPRTFGPRTPISPALQTLRLFDRRRHGSSRRESKTDHRRAASGG